MRPAPLRPPYESRIGKTCLLSEYPAAKPGGTPSVGPSNTASQWGNVFATVALSLLVFDLTGSALGVSGIVAVEIIRVLLLAPFVGKLVARLPGSR